MADQPGKHEVETRYFEELLDRFPTPLPGSAGFRFGPLWLTAWSPGFEPGSWAPLAPEPTPPAEPGFRFTFLWGIDEELIRRRSEFRLQLGGHNQVQAVRLGRLLLLNLYTHTLIVVDADGGRAVGMTDERLGLESRDWAMKLQLTTLVPCLLSRLGLITLHASAAALDGCGIVMPGPKGCGKSSLALALVGLGFEFLADDNAVLDPGALSVFPFPEDIRLPTGSAGSAVPESDKRVLEAGAARGRAPARLDALVFPARSGADRVTLKKLKPGETMRRLMPLMITPPFLVDHEELMRGLEALSSLVAAHELDAPDPDSGAEALRELGR